jgi:hypothetical protein
VQPAGDVGRGDERQDGRIVLLPFGEITVEIDVWHGNPAAD